MFSTLSIPLALEKALDLIDKGSFKATFPAALNSYPENWLEDTSVISLLNCILLSLECLVAS